MRAWWVLGLLLVGVVVRGEAVDSLATYNVDIYETSISGLSSGGFFAVQMHVAFSSVMKGAGVFAGGPYHCAESSIETAVNKCMNTKNEPKVAPLISLTDDRAQSGLVDPTSNLATQKVFMFSGTKDTTVAQPVMNGLRDYYENYIDKNQIQYENSIKAAHTQPTDDPVNKNACTVSSSPYLSDCHYDGTGMALNQIYGSLEARNDGKLSGSLLEYNQREFIGDGLGMASSGYLYVPQPCANGTACKLHVSFHGCEQDYKAVGSDWIENAGYNKWADTNNMIILYPQAEKSYSHPYNPDGCWDWWGYNNPDNYDTKNGDQMNASWAMILRITGGFISPPSELTAFDVTNQSVSLKWQPSTTPEVSYNVFRNGTQVNVDPINGLNFEDQTVSTGTFYSYTVESEDTSNHQSQPSSPVVVQTAGPLPPLIPPQNLISTGTTASSVAFSWDPVSGATEYNVYRNNSFLDSSMTTSFNDTTVSPVSTYSYQVTASNGSDESTPSSSLVISTPTAWSCYSVKSSNYEHVQKGRAYQKLGYAYAVGSNDAMGLDNTAIYNTLSETSQDYYVLGGC